MCYGLGCKHERSDGSCGKSKYEDCPEKYDDEQNCMAITHGHDIEEYRDDEPIEEFMKRAVYFRQGGYKYGISV